MPTPATPMPPIPLPDPYLADDLVRLRPWTTGDAPALAAAWADPEIARWTGAPPPERRTVAAAARWIDGQDERHRRGLALDLVIAPAEDHGDDNVLGEVGIGPIDWNRRIANIGWWVVASARGQGVATRAVTLLARWAEPELGLRLVAAVEPANPASVRVATKAGVPASKLA